MKKMFYLNQFKILGKQKSELKEEKIERDAKTNTI